MKTLLLILGVVAFVYLDSGYSLECKTCNKTIPIPLSCAPVTCPAPLDQCYKNITFFPDSMTIMKIERGCTTNCSLPLPSTCCKINGCNL